MKETRQIMGMPIEVEIIGENVEHAIDGVFEYFVTVDNRFSTYKPDSEISRINRGELSIQEASEEMREVLAISEKTREETGGYFNIRRPDDLIDPSGIVKGWAILRAAELISRDGFGNYFVNAGGDIAMSGKNSLREEWSVGIINPFNTDEIIKVVYPHGKGVATSGSYERGNHIYNPLSPGEHLKEIVSITVIGPDVLEADRFATAAFAMGKGGIMFIEELDGFEGYSIDATGIATQTSGFGAYV